MPLSTQPYKGARDFYPEDKRLQKYLFKTMRKVVESYGYEEYDAPILEPLDLYLAKTGEEIVDEQTYTFEDRGGRKVAVRPEMTPTVSRMVAGKRQELAYPARWYSIPNLWRYERPQRGRLREHWQLNVDLFGVAALSAEHEMIELADHLMKAYGAKADMYTIKINSRKLMDSIMRDYLCLNDVQQHSVSKLIDRMHKMDQAEFAAQIDALMSPSERDAGNTDKLLNLLKVKNLAELPAELADHEAVRVLKKLFAMLDNSSITNAVFDISLMRGFDYYTDVVFEVFDNHPDNNRSLFGGGRYDGLVGLFGVEPVPTVGFGAGDVTLANFLEVHGLMPTLPAEADVYTVLVGDVYQQAHPAITKLRKIGLRVAVDSTGRKPGSQIKSADKKGIRYALIIGEQELESEQFVLKDLQSGTEEKHSLERIASIIRDYRKK